MENNNNSNNIGGFNTACENFKQKIIDNINSSNIPIAPIYYIMSMIYQEVEKTYYATLNEELLSVAPQEQEQKEQENNEE